MGSLAEEKKGILFIFEEQLPQTVISQTTVINSNRVSLPGKYSPSLFFFLHIFRGGESRSRRRRCGKCQPFITLSV